MTLEERVMNKKLLIQALLFLPIIIGILLFVVFAAYADTSKSGDSCDVGEFRTSGTTDAKTLYGGGVYKDLTFFRKLGARASIYEWSPKFNKTAIAFAFPTDKVIRMVHEKNQEDVLSELFLHGKVALARRHEDTLKLVPSPEALWALATAKGNGTIAPENKEDPATGPGSDDSMAEALSSPVEKEGMNVTFHNRSNEPVGNWITVWKKYSEEYDVASLYVAGEMMGNEMVGGSVEIGDLVTISAEKSIFGLCNEGRVITWNGVKTLPDISAFE